VPRILGDISEQEMHAYRYSTTVLEHQEGWLGFLEMIIFLWACLPWGKWETRSGEKERRREDFQVDK